MSPGRTRRSRHRDASCRRHLRASGLGTGCTHGRRHRSARRRTRDPRSFRPPSPDASVPVTLTPEVLAEWATSPWLRSLPVRPHAFFGTRAAPNASPVASPSSIPVAVVRCSRLASSSASLTVGAGVPIDGVGASCSTGPRVSRANRGSSSSTRAHTAAALKSPSAVAASMSATSRTPQRAQIGSRTPRRSSYDGRS